MTKKRTLISSIITSALSIIFLCVFINTGQQRFLISFILLLALTGVNIICVNINSDVIKSNLPSSKDVNINLKASHLLLKILNYTLCSLIFVFVIVYAIIKNDALLTVIITLCSVLLFLFLGYLILSIYLDKKGGS